MIESNQPRAAELAMNYIRSLVFVGSVVCGLTAAAPLAKATDLPFSPTQGRVAVSVPTDTTGRTLSDNFKFVPFGTSIMTLDGTSLSLTTTDMVQDIDSSDVATVVEPLAFSPNGRRMALKVWQHGYQIYIREDDAHLTWVTRNLIERVEGTSSAPYNHMEVLWSPSSERLAIFSTVDQDALISVFDGDSVRVVLTNQSGDEATVWSKDETALIAGVYAGPNHWQMLRIPVDGGKPDTLFDAAQAIGGPVWNPAYDTLAFNVGSSVYLSDGKTAHKAFGTHVTIRSISWSTDGRRLALSDSDGGVLIVQKDGQKPWMVTRWEQNKWLIPNVVWLNERQFAFIQVTSRPEATRLYVGDVATQSVKLAPTGDIACTKLQAIAGGVLYFKVMSRGTWIERDRVGSEDMGGPDRSVKLDLHYWSPAYTTGIRLTRESFDTSEDEQDYTVYLYPKFWVSPH